MTSLAANAATISISAEASRVDPNAFKFVVDRPIHPGGPFVYADANAAGGSPLPARLFALGGIASLLVAENVVSVTKTPEADWQALLRPIGQATASSCSRASRPSSCSPWPRAMAHSPTRRWATSSAICSPAR